MGDRELAVQHGGWTQRHLRRRHEELRGSSHRSFTVWSKSIYLGGLSCLDRCHESSTRTTAVVQTPRATCVHEDSKLPPCTRPGRTPGHLCRKISCCSNAYKPICASIPHWRRRSDKSIRWLGQRSKYAADGFSCPNTLPVHVANKFFYNFSQ
jgi:hypothetical protein